VVSGGSSSPDDCYAWMPEESWKMEAEDETELDRIIEKFVYDTLEFFTVSSYENIIIEEIEIEKVKQFILENIIAK